MPRAPQSRALLAGRPAAKRRVFSSRVAAWRSMQGLADADDHGTDAKGLAIRGGLLVSAVTHTLLAVFAFSLVIGTGGGSGGGSGDWTAKLMQAPAGRWLVAAVGIAVIGAGIAQMVKGWKETFRKYLSAGPDTMRWAAPVGRWGLIVKGVVFLIIGGFLILAAVQADPSEARGLGGALDAVRSQPFGRVLLGLVAVGLIFFAAYSAIEARFRRIGT